MTRLWPAGQRIDVTVSARGQPVRFTWCDRTYKVHRIQQRWQVDSDWWSEEGRVWRDYLALLTTEGLLCVIYYDLLDQEWRLSKIYD